MGSGDKTVSGGSGDKVKSCEEWTAFSVDDIPGDIEHANIGTSYSEKTEAYRTVIDLSKIPANQVILYCYGKTDDGTGDMEVYDVTNSQQLCEFLNLANSDEWKNSGWTALPSNVLGTTITITIRVKGANATTDFFIDRLYVKLRRN